MKGNSPCWTKMIPDGNSTQHKTNNAKNGNSEGKYRSLWQVQKFSLTLNRL